MPSGVIASANLDVKAFMQSAWRLELVRRRVAKEGAVTSEEPIRVAKEEDKNGAVTSEQWVRRLPLLTSEEWVRRRLEWVRKEKANANSEGDTVKETWCDTREHEDSDGGFQSAEEADYGC